MTYPTKEAACAAFRQANPTLDGLTEDQLVEEGYVDEDSPGDWVTNDPEVLTVQEADDYVEGSAIQVHNTALPKSGLDGKCPHCGASTRDGSERRVTEFHELSPGSQNSTDQLYTCNECAGEWGPVVEKPRRARAPSGSSNGLKIEQNRETRNGVTRPSIGGKCRRVWDMLDEIGLDATAKQARARATELGLDKTTCMVQFYRWRKFNGIEGRQA